MGIIDSACDAEPIFYKRQFLIIFAYHVLNMMVLGPISIPFIMIFEKYQFLKNTAFVPMKSTLAFCISQNLCYLAFIGAVYLLIEDWYKY